MAEHNGYSALAASRTHFAALCDTPALRYRDLAFDSRIVCDTVTRCFHWS